MTAYPGEKEHEELLGISIPQIIRTSTDQIAQKIAPIDESNVGLTSLRDRTPLACDIASLLFGAKVLLEK